MKLKKIASLMLAGVMAVSMLAGCSTASDKEEGGASSNPTAPTTSNVVTYANDCLSGAQKEVFTFKASSELDTILKAAATDVDNMDSSNIANIFDSTTVNRGFSKGDNDGEKKILKAVKGKLDGIVTDKFTELPSTNINTQKAVEVYSVSGAFEEKAAIQKVVNDYKQYISNQNFPESVKNKACEYEAEISAIKVVSPEKSNDTAWIVAMVFTQTSTSTANTASSAASK